MNKYLHWLIVGYVSPQANKHILANGGRINEIAHDPPFIAVGLPDSDEKYTSWSHGRIQYRDAIEFWNTGEIQMEHMTLYWGPRNAECHSAHETYLICSFEEWDQAKHQVKPEQEESSEPVPIPLLNTVATGHADDFDPFLDSDDLP